MQRSETNSKIGTLTPDLYENDFYAQIFPEVCPYTVEDTLNPNFFKE